MHTVTLTADELLTLSLALNEYRWRKAEQIENNRSAIRAWHDNPGEQARFQQLLNSNTRRLRFADAAIAKMENSTLT